jgi:hypothetical protein
MTMQLAFAFDQRWEHRREFRLTAGAINPREFGVDICPTAEAAAFIRRHHYSGSFPAEHISVGLYRTTGIDRARLVGVATFSEGMASGRALPKYTGFAATEGTELGRLVLLPEVAFNGESWFIARAFQMLRATKPRVRAVLSYADPVERWLDGRLVKPGHVGTIYAASNATYCGRSTPRTEAILPDGTPLLSRAIQKVRHQERGAAGVERRLIALGLAERAFGEDPADWINRVVAALPTRRHPGKHVYVFGLDREAKRRATGLNPSLPYPKAAACPRLAA